jgi:hypothetical protein
MYVPALGDYLHGNQLTMKSGASRCNSLPFKGAQAGFRRAPLCAAGAAERSGDFRAGVGMGLTASL